MRKVKDYIFDTLFITGFNSFFYFEQSNKSRLLGNLDSAEFFGGTGTLSRNEETGLTETLTNSVGEVDAVYHDRRQKLKMAKNQQLRLMMKNETAESRLEKFYSLIYNSEAQSGHIARILDKETIMIDGQETEQGIYYDIVSVRSQDGKEYKINSDRPNIVEVILTFEIQYGIFQSREGVTVEDFPVDIDIIEE